MTIARVSRRRLLGAGAAAGGLLLGGCDKLSNSPRFVGLLDQAEGLTMGAQRLITGRDALAPEFSTADLSPTFRSNGNDSVRDPLYNQLLQNAFRDWRLVVNGLVTRPAAFSHPQLRAMPRRTQITRHDCVEGWSAIGMWTGVPLHVVLSYCGGLLPSARYLVFHCFDDFYGKLYYESIDIVDALHPQTILAYGLNGKALPVANGAPLRLRVERQLGYKQAKFLKGIEAVASLKGIGDGKGGFWEDISDYEWYAGI